MRHCILALCVAGWIGHATAHAATWQPPAGHTQIPIWPAVPPGAPAKAAAESSGVVDKLVAGRPWTYVRNVSQPTLTVYSPNEKNTGAAVVVFPGGGYQVLAIDLEGTEVCEWLASRGITCALLKYRVPNAGPGWDQHCGCERASRSSKPLEDAQRAIGLLRSRAADWHIDPHKVGVLGFSAGGHLAAMASTHFDRRVYPAVDATDSQSCRPDFAVAIYPGHLFDYSKSALYETLHITPETPPTFLLHAENDPVDGVSHTLAYFDALKNDRVPTELHIYPTGGHAFGLRATQEPITAWPRLVEAWLRTLGVIPAE